MFKTALTFVDRPTRQRYVADKFKAILHGRVLDVGADEGYIQQFLPAETDYKGVGLGGKNPAVMPVDFEKEALPVADKSADCVLCLDVLEHVENPYALFDELCRVSADYVLISLPNPLADLMNALRGKNYAKDKLFKFYGFPTAKEEDRHKWFFAGWEARHFIEKLAAKNGFEVYYYEQLNASHITGRAWLKRRLFGGMMRVFVRNTSVSADDMLGGTMWWVLKRKA